MASGGPLLFGRWAATARVMKKERYEMMTMHIIGAKPETQLETQRDVSNQIWIWDMGTRAA